MFSSISLSRWKRTSSSSSSSILDLKKSARNRSLSLLSMAISSHSGRFQNQFYSPREPSPGLGLRRQLFPTGGGQFHMLPRNSTDQKIFEALIANWRENKVTERIIRLKRNGSNRSAGCTKYGRQRLDSGAQSNYALRRCGATSISQSKTGNALQRRCAQFCCRFSSKGGYC